MGGAVVPADVEYVSDLAHVKVSGANTDESSAL